MDNSEFMLDMQRAFSETGFLFELVRVSDEEWKLCSNLCVIQICFERYDDGFSIEMCEPETHDRPLKLLLLRFLTGADVPDSSDESSPFFIASVIVQFLQPLLEGDFSIRSKYTSIEDEFFTALFAARNSSGAVREKISKFDISFIHDVNERP